MSKILIIQAEYRKIKNELAESFTIHKEKFINDYDFLPVDSLNLLIDRKNNIFDLKVSGRDISTFDLLFVKIISLSSTEWVSIISYYFSKILGKKVVNSSYAKFIAQGRIVSKLLQALKFYELNIPTPKTMFFSNNLLPMAFSIITKEMGEKFIVKSTKGSKGKNNYLIKSKSEFLEFISNINNIHDASMEEPSEFIIQEFIPNDSDYRVFCLGYEPAVIIKRTRIDDNDHRNNISLGATGEILEPSSVNPKMLEIAREVAKNFSYEVCGVDIIENKDTNELVVLEVNTNPNLLSPIKPSPKLLALDKYFTSITNN